MPESDMLFIEFNEPAPINPGMYLVESPAWEKDNRPCVCPVWVFIYADVLHYMGIGEQQGKPLASCPYLNNKWSKRITREMEGE